MKLLLNKLLINLLASGLVLSSAPMDAYFKCETVADKGKKADWVTFTSKENGFSVDLPKQPEQVHQKLDVPKTDLSIEYDTYVSEINDSVVYVVSVWHYPAELDMSQPEVNLQDGFGGMLSALPNSQVLNMKMTDVQSFKALEFLVKNDDIYFQGRLILVYNTLYQVFSVYKGVDTTKTTYQQFSDSFTLINPEKNKVAAPKSTKTSEASF